MTPFLHIGAVGARGKVETVYSDPLIFTLSCDCIISTEDLSIDRPENSIRKKPNPTAKKPAQNGRRSIVESKMASGNARNNVKTLIVDAISKPMGEREMTTPSHIATNEDARSSALIEYLMSFL